MGAKRGASGTRQREVFLLLRDVGSMSLSMIAERIGCSIESARKACRYLRERGFVEHRRMAGATGGRTLCAAVKRGPPEDRRGKTGKAAKVRLAYPKWIMMMANRHGKHWRPPTRPGTALEAAWPTPVFKKSAPQPQPKGSP